MVIILIIHKFWFVQTLRIFIIAKLLTISWDVISDNNTLFDIFVSSCVICDAPTRIKKNPSDLLLFSSLDGL